MHRFCRLTKRQSRSFSFYFPLFLCFLASLPQDSKDSTVWLLCVDCKCKLSLAASQPFYMRLERLLGHTARQQGSDPSRPRLSPFIDGAVKWRFCTETHLLAQRSLFLQHLLWRILFWLMPRGSVAQRLSQPPSTICAGQSACFRCTSYSSHTQMPSNQFRWRWHVLSNAGFESQISYLGPFMNRL